MMNDTVKTTDENPAESEELKALKQSCEQYIEHLERRIKRLNPGLVENLQQYKNDPITTKLMTLCQQNGRSGRKTEVRLKYILMIRIKTVLDAQEVTPIEKILTQMNINKPDALLEAKNNSEANLEEKKKISIRAILAHKPNQSSNKTNLEKLKDATGHPKGALVKRALAQLSCWCGVGLVYLAIYRSPTFFGRVHGDVVAEKMTNYYNPPKAGG